VKPVPCFSINSRQEDMGGDFTENYEKRHKQRYQVMFFSGVTIILLRGPECVLVQFVYNIDYTHVIYPLVC